MREWNWEKFLDYIEKYAFYPLEPLKTKHIRHVTPFTLQNTSCVFFFKVNFLKALPIGRNRIRQRVRDLDWENHVLSILKSLLFTIRTI